LKRHDASINDGGLGCLASAQFERIQVIVCCSAVPNIGDARGIEHVERFMASARGWIVVLRKKSDPEQQVLLFCSH
jgi:hypothetical protein